MVNNDKMVTVSNRIMLPAFVDVYLKSSLIQLNIAGVSVAFYTRNSKHPHRVDIAIIYLYLIQKLNSQNIFFFKKTTCLYYLLISHWFSITTFIVKRFGWLLTDDPFLFSNHRTRNSPKVIADILAFEGQSFHRSNQSNSEYLQTLEDEQAFQWYWLSFD